MDIDIAAVRRQYGTLVLNEADMPKEPIVQFENWLSDALNTELDPTAMVLATIDQNGSPDARVVLLKDINAGTLVFFTNYQSHKGDQLRHNAQASIVFYWPTLTRQVRFRGSVNQLSRSESEIYFSSRPIESQISALISPQSQVIPSRNWLIEAYETALTQYGNQKLFCPEFWGGYQFVPNEVEFFQGRDNRLHDRIQYSNHKNQWVIHRLAP